MKKLAGLAVLALLAAPSMARAECSGTVTRADVARCAVQASLSVRASVQAGEAIEGKRVSVSPLLPSNPVVAVTAGRRESDLARATNWSVTLSQELEIAGQRGARKRAAELEGEAQTQRTTSARREAAASAWSAYFEAIAADEEVRLATRLAANAAQIAMVAKATSERGLLSPVEADVADAASVSVEQVQIAAERRSRTARLAFATLLGLDPAAPLGIEGELDPLKIEDEARAALGADGRDRPEVRALEAERRAQEATASAFARARVPNVTVSLFMQNDGFDERVLGAGLSLPLPMPQPIGRFKNGEIAEANALANRAGTEAERARRTARLELLSALSDYDARKRQRDAFTDERIKRAEQSIEAIAREIQAQRIPLRDALVSQQALVSMLRAGLDARLALCQASVELARAASIPLEQGTPR